MNSNCRNENLSPITCLGKDNVERTFYWNRENQSQSKGRSGFVLRFFQGSKVDGEFFEAGFIEYDDELQVVMLSHHYVPAYMKKGLPEAAILCAATQTDRTVVSSTNLKENKRLPNEYQQPEAKKVWLRLVNRGLATLRDDGRYIILRNCS